MDRRKVKRTIVVKELRCENRPMRKYEVVRGMLRQVTLELRQERRNCFLDLGGNKNISWSLSCLSATAPESGIFAH
jgi:hypothetical protein